MGEKVIERVGRSDPVAYSTKLGSLVPREMVLQREREPAFNLDALTLTEFVKLLDATRKRESTRRAFVETEPPG